MTGKKKPRCQQRRWDDHESRSNQDVPLELLNIAEKKRFMDGEKVRPGLPLAGDLSTFTLDYDAQSIL